MKIFFLKYTFKQKRIKRLTFSSSKNIQFTPADIIRKWKSEENFYFLLASIINVKHHEKTLYKNVIKYSFVVKLLLAWRQKFLIIATNRLKEKPTFVLFSS